MKYYEGNLFLYFVYINETFCLFYLLMFVLCTVFQEHIYEGVKDAAPDVSDDLADAEILDFGLTEYEMKPSDPEVKPNCDTQSLKQKETDEESHYFSAHRSFSLPVKLDEAKSDQQFTINQHFSDGVISPKSMGQDKTDESKSCVRVIDPSPHLEDLSSQGSTTPTQAVTPGSSVSDADELDKHCSAAGCESEEDEFTFPPLKVVSQRSISDEGPSKVFPIPESKGLDQAQISEDESRGYMLRTDAPQSMSSRASSITPDWNPDDENEFTGCIDSDIAFPHPADINQAVMPVSGSAVDVIIMLQRLCCFCQNLVSMMLAEIPSITVSRQSSFHIRRQFSASSHDNECEAGDLSETLTIYEQPSPLAESLNCSSSIPQMTAGSGSGSDTACTSVQEGSNHHEHSEPGTPELTLPKRLGIKLALHLRMLKVRVKYFFISTNITGDDGIQPNCFHFLIIHMLL